jgi:putative transposase
MRGVAIRIARYVNDLLRRRGPLWADRWHGHALRSPREVRNAIVYVLTNFRKHGGGSTAMRIDPYSSAPWFDGFGASNSGLPPALDEIPVRASVLGSHGLQKIWRSGEDVQSFAPRTWLLRRGWRRYGLLRATEGPACPRDTIAASACAHSSRAKRH